MSEENAGRSLSGGRAPGDTRPDTVTRPMGSSNGPKGADGPKGSAICRLWPPLVVGAALLFMLSTSPDTTPPQARLGAGASYRRAGEFALRERKLEAAVSLDVPGERQPALRLSDVDTEAPADLGSGDSDAPGAQGVYATMELTSVVSVLESHWVVLDAELSEIKKDYNSLRVLTRRHGEFWRGSMKQLNQLRVHKESLLKECV